MNSQPETDLSTDVIDQQEIISVIQKVAGQAKQAAFTRQETHLIWHALLRLYFDQYPIGTTEGLTPGTAENRVTDKLLRQLDMEMREPVALV